MLEQAIEKPSQSIRNRWRYKPRGLQINMTITYIKISFMVIFSLQVVRMLIFILLKESVQDLIVPFFVTISVLVIVPLIGGIFGFVASRGLIQRMKTLVSATTQCAQGNYQQHVQVHEGDEVGHLEEHFNLMADKLAENTQQLRLLTEQNARMAERGRIARDLHDSIKQQVFAIGMQAGATLSLLDRDTDTARKHLQEMEEQVYQVQIELSSLIQELRPTHLQEKGLALALPEYVATWSRRQSIEAECLIKVESVPYQWEETLWRVAQEALSNVARHSKASRVCVQLEEKGKMLEMEIQDNGPGFDIHTIKAGIGLASMRERIEITGGTMEIISTPVAGTRIHVQYICEQVENKRQKEEIEQ